MAILLLCSVFLSGSETAFSNISRLQARRLHESSNRLHNLAARLINKPKQLLTSLLFGNMVVNVLFFSLASVLSVGLGKELGPMAAIVSAALAFMVLLFVGEMLQNHWPTRTADNFRL